MNQAQSTRWEQVKELFEAVLAQPFAERDDYLAQACGDDELRREVESLIKSYEQAGSFLEEPAVQSAAESLLENQQKLSARQRVNHYEILAAIGEGGMGEVYLARDTRLGRRVALKLLPDYFASDAHRMRRFRQEARAASVLSHPNVCVIHEVGETEDGRPFLTMEYVEGPTLRQRLAKGMKLREALDVAAQIADALSAAHDAGIVHRDIKPENIVLRPDGYAKVLDFGLAKLTDKREGFDTETGTTLMRTSTAGLVMGTVAYMSPEQARGVTVDHRTDIWSLGVVLYEMISGHVPFEGETPTDVVVGIVEREQPALTESVAELPPELDRMVRKALRKDRDERYQLAKELAIDLRSLRRDLEAELELGRSSVPPVAKSQTHVNRATANFDASRHTTTLPPNLNSNLRRIVLIGLAALMTSGVFFLGYRMLRKNPVANQHRFQRINVTKLTTNGNAVFAAISRDGKYVAYVMNEGAQQSLWLRQVAVENNVRIQPARDGRYLGIAFSPDSNHIYYGYVEGNQGPQLYKIPVLAMGAVATRVDLYKGPESASHDGKRIAFFRYDDQNREDRLMVANAEGGNEQVVATRKWPERFGWSWDARPAWSSNNEKLSSVLVDVDSPTFFLKLYEIGLSDRADRTITLTGKKFELLQGVTMLEDASGVIATAKAEGASFLQVWQLLRDGTTQQITNDLSDYVGMSLTADSASILTIQRQVLSNIWASRKSDALHAAPLTSGAGRYFDICWTPDGKILYASDASGNAHIYEMDLQGANSRALTDLGRNYAPTVSPDNRYIAYHSNRTGSFQIWRADRDGSDPKQMTNGPESNWPQFTSDGKWIVYQHVEPDSAGSIWKVPIEGGTPVKAWDQFAMRPTVSPDGKWIACWARDNPADSPWRLALVPFAGSGLARYFDVPSTVEISWDVLIRWSVDGRSITYLDHRGGFDNLWSQPIDGSPARQVTVFKDSRIFSFDWSGDSRLLTSRGVQTNDVVLISEAK
jgi:serine/threonine protein kinase/Tol biopolymer transport system component